MLWNVIFQEEVNAISALKCATGIVKVEISFLFWKQIGGTSPTHSLSVRCILGESTHYIQLMLNDASEEMRFYLTKGNFDKQLKVWEI